MAKSEKLTVTLREERGKRLMRKLRRQGRVPGVIYGHGDETLSLSVDRDELATAVRHGARVVDVEHDGNTEKALIRELQWDTFGQEILHFDLTRVSRDERIEISVPINLRGTPRGVREGGVLEQTMHEAQIECLATDVPAEIRVAVAELGLDDAVHVRDLSPPSGVKVLDDADAVVAHVKAAVALVEEVAEAGAAEPEVIGREAEPAEEEQ